MQMATLRWGVTGFWINDEEPICSEVHFLHLVQYPILLCLECFLGFDGVVVWTISGKCWKLIEIHSPKVNAMKMVLSSSMRQNQVLRFYIMATSSFHKMKLHVINKKNSKPTWCHYKPIPQSIVAPSLNLNPNPNGFGIVPVSTHAFKLQNCISQIHNIANLMNITLLITMSMRILELRNSCDNNKLVTYGHREGEKESWE
jgi:hypothetical protein